MRNRLIIFYQIFSIFLYLSLQSQEINNNISINKYINPDIIKKAGQPIYTDKGVIITLDATNIYEVFLRTDLDNWSKNYNFTKNYYGIYWCFIPYNPEKKRYLYRLNINGFWNTNPYSEEYYEDNYGNRFSILYLPEKVIYEKPTPIINDISENAKKVRFQIYFPEAKFVNLVISYDNYSSFSNSMEKDDKGYWILEKILGRGIYKYYFIVDGKKFVDINNKNKSFDIELGETSLLEIR